MEKAIWAKFCFVVLAGATLSACDTYNAIGNNGSGSSSRSAGLVGGGSGSSIVSTIYTGGIVGKSHGVYVPNLNSISIGARSQAGGETATVVRGDEAGSFTATGTAQTNISNAEIVGTASEIFPNTYTVGNSIIYSKVNAIADHLTSTHYGLVVTTNGSSGDYNAFHAGTLTPVSDMPTGGTASYTGSFNGFLLTDGASAVTEIFGTTSLNANFGAGTMTGSVDNMLPIGAGTNPNYDLGINATISGSTYSGTVDYTNAFGVPTGTVTTSSVSGGFYSSDASETTGALRIEGNPDGANSAIVGAFGASRN